MPEIKSQAVRVFNRGKDDWTYPYDSVPYTIPAGGSIVVKPEAGEHLVRHAQDAVDANGLPILKIDLEEIPILMGSADELAKELPVVHPETGQRFKNLVEMIKHVEQAATEKVLNSVIGGKPETEPEPEPTPPGNRPTVGVEAFAHLDKREVTQLAKAKGINVVARSEQQIREALAAAMSNPPADDEDDD